MRIVYIHQYYKNRSSPGSTRSFEFAKRLVQDGHDVEVVTTGEAPGNETRGWSTDVDEGILVHRVRVPYANNMSYARRIVAFVHFSVLASIRAARLRPDLVFATSTPLTVAIPGVLAARLHRVPFVFEVRDLWPELPIELGALRNPLARWAAFRLARTAYRNASEVVALSPGMVDGVVSHGYPREHVTLIPNGSDIELFGSQETPAREFRSSRPWLGTRPLVVYAGHVSTANGVDYLVRLAAAVRQRSPEVRFLVVGYGRDVPAVTEQARDAGLLDESFFLMDRLPKAEMPAVLGAATVATSLFLPLPGLRDNSPNKVFDALAAGRPVVINYGGWQADLLETSGAGLTLPYDDVEAAADLLVAALADQEWLCSAGAAARALAEQRFSREKQYEQLVQVLQAAASPTRHPARHQLTARAG